MPRVANRGINVSEWARGTNGSSSTWDVCNDCYVDLLQMPHAYDHILYPYNGDPPGRFGRVGDVAHPDYNENIYRCAVCRTELSEVRDGDGYAIAEGGNLLDEYYRNDSSDNEKSLREVAAIVSERLVTHAEHIQVHVDPLMLTLQDLGNENAQFHLRSASQHLSLLLHSLKAVRYWTRENNDE